MLKMSIFESLYGGQFTLSTQLIKPNYLVTCDIDCNKFWSQKISIHPKKTLDTQFEQFHLSENLSSLMCLPQKLSFRMSNDLPHWQLVRKISFHSLHQQTYHLFLNCSIGGSALGILNSTLMGCMSW